MPLSVVWAYGVLAALLIAAAVWDLRTGRIPNYLTYPAAAVGLIGHTLAGGLGNGPGPELGLGGSAAGLAVGFLPLYAVFLMGGIGGGDVKLMGAVGALTGWRFALSALLYSLLAGVVLSIWVMIRHRVARRTLLRVGRFLVLALWPKGAADPASPDSPKVPFGVAVCLGAAAALIEALLVGPDGIKWLLRI